MSSGVPCTALSEAMAPEVATEREGNGCGGTVDRGAGGKDGRGGGLGGGGGG